VITRKPRRECSPIYLYSREQSFIAALMDAIPNNFLQRNLDEPDFAELGSKIWEVLENYQIDQVSKKEINPDLGTLYDIMHRMGENA